MWRLKPWTLKRAQAETIFDADTDKHCPEAQLKMCTVLGAPSVWKTVEFRIGPLVHLWPWETKAQYESHTLLLRANLNFVCLLKST